MSQHDDDATPPAIPFVMAVQHAADVEEDMGDDRPLVSHLRSRKALNPVEAELRLLRHSFVEQGTRLGALTQVVDRIESKLMSQEVQIASLRQRFDELEHRVYAMERQMLDMNNKLDTISDVLQALLSKMSPSV